MNALFLKTKKLTERNHILVAARHNLREIQAEIGVDADSGIDPSKICENIVLIGHKTAKAVAHEANTKMDDAGVGKLRKDAVRALEVLVSLPEDTTVDTVQFFTVSTSWAAEYFKAPILSAVIHNDESTPHCHILILPLINGHMVGSDLNGNQQKLSAMHTDFYNQVGQRYGLSRPRLRKKYSYRLRSQMLEMASNLLQTNSGLSDRVVQVLIEPHQSNPEPLMNVLGLEIPKSVGVNEFVKIMTKPCKPEKPAEVTRKKPIGFGDVGNTSNCETLCSVGFENHDTAPLSSVQPIQPEIDAEFRDSYVRFRDDIIPAENWDLETGEPYPFRL